MRTRLIGLAAILSLLAVGQALAQTERRTLEFGGYSRTYLLHVPPALQTARPAPLVIVFHGGGGQGFGTERLTHFSRIADRENFVVAYPDGIGRQWNDGRTVRGLPAQREQVDDVAFISAMIESIAGERAIDRKRIYATGISNGAIFSHFLAARLSTKIAAIAPVVGGMAENVARDFRPAEPVSVLIIQGTLDPLVPFDGGAVARRNHGRIIPTHDAIRLWVTCDHCAPNPRHGELPDRDPADGCRVRTAAWSSGRGGSDVTLYTIEGGGHTWPGGAQYLPRWIVGAVCRDFDASEEIWSFFKLHPKS
jgi:polyhydroxybutyrate depolymerase